MYTETIEVVDLPKMGYKALAVHREYETPEDAIESDAAGFHFYAKSIALEHIKEIAQEQLLDQSDKSDPHNCSRVWILKGPAL